MGTGDYLSSSFFLGDYRDRFSFLGVFLAGPAVFLCVREWSAHHSVSTCPLDSGAQTAAPFDSWWDELQKLLVSSLSLRASLDCCRVSQSACFRKEHSESCMTVLRLVLVFQPILSLFNCKKNWRRQKKPWKNWSTEWGLMAEGRFSGLRLFLI